MHGTLIGTESFFKYLYKKMKEVNRGIDKLEFYEFMYAMKNISPSEGWETVPAEKKEVILQLIRDRSFYENIEVRPKPDGHTVLDPAVVGLTRSLFRGLAEGCLEPKWLREYFTFDVRGFFFLPRTRYFTKTAVKHLGGSPYQQFSREQEKFELYQGIGYGDFMEANRETDAAFLRATGRIVEGKGTPVIIGIAGPTAAGKTEITERLRIFLEDSGFSVTSIEMDNFFTDRDYREARGVHSMGREALHFELLQACLRDLSEGRNTLTPRYGYIRETSSHDESGRLKPGMQGIKVEPADIIFLEGNFPFLFQEIAPLIGIRVVYLTSDEIRLKRKWKRDIDYLKKYEVFYFINRYFRTQYLKALDSYIPQLEVCDIAVDTTGAALWVRPGLRAFL